MGKNATLYQKDFYSQQAKKEGYPSRAVYKLSHIDQKHKLLRPGVRVLELGAAPGSWQAYGAPKTGEKGLWVGLDRQKFVVPALAKKMWVKNLELDVFQEESMKLVGQYAPFQLFLSDMAPNTSGIAWQDAENSSQLAWRVFSWAEKYLSPEGSVLVKLLQGKELPKLKAWMKPRFSKVSTEKPPASRSFSVELFLLGQGWKPRKESPS